MTKLIIPTILTATILIAGMFAFMPVQKAATVHTTIQNSQIQLKTTSDALAAALAGSVITIDLNAPFTLVSLTVSCTQGSSATACEADESMDLATFTVDGGTNAATITTALVAGAAGPGTSIIALVDQTAGSGSINISARDRIAITMANDIASAGVGNFSITVDIAVETLGSTTVSAAEITFA